MSYRFDVGDEVSTEYGKGKVEAMTDRSVTVLLHSGDKLNIQRGTPGYDRIRNVTKGDAERSQGGFRW